MTSLRDRALIKVIPLRAVRPDVAMPAYSGDPSSSSTSVRKWTPQQVASWVTNQGFTSYAPLFVEHEIDGASLLELDIRDLSCMGVSVVGQRHTLHRLIRNLAESTN